MAAITLRIRQVLPQFFADEDMAELNSSAQLLYIGLWCVADDAGYFPWKPGEIAYALNFRGGRKAVTKGVEDIRALSGRCRVELLGCGRHAMVPNLAEYQRYAKSTHNVVRHKREHQAECFPANIPQIPHESPANPPLGTERYGTGRKELGKTTTDEAIQRAKAKAAAS
jgi:hypothetical protein